LKIVLVNLNNESVCTRTSLNQEFLRCSVAYIQNTVATRRVAMGDNGAMPPTVPKFSG